MATFKFDVGTGRLGSNRLKSRWYADSTALQKRLVYSEDFLTAITSPILFTQTAGATALATAGTPTIAQGATDLLQMPSGAIWEIFATTAQTLTPVQTAGTGLDIGLDLVNNESVEYVPFGNSAYNPFAYTVGTTQPMLFRAAFNFADVSGTDQFVLGWRKQETYAVPTSIAVDGIYTDFFGIGFAGTVASPNPVRVTFDKNNGGTATVAAAGFTWADGKTHIMECRLYGTKVRFFINGTPLGSIVGTDGVGGDITDQQTTSHSAATLDSGDVMIPFIFHRYDATSPGAVVLQAVQLGPLSEFGLDPNNE